MSKAKFSTSSENFSSNGGFVWVSELLDSIPMMSLWDKLLPCRCNTRFSAQVMVRSAIGLMTAGSNNFVDVEKFRGDVLFRRLLDNAVPSQETFRQRLNLLAQKEWMPLIDQMSATLLNKAKLARITM